MEPAKDARPCALAASISERLAEVRTRIADAGGDPEGVRVVAVTKGFGPDAVVAAARAGLHDVGENYADELIAKRVAVEGLGVSVRWHFLGAVQRNKVSRLADVVDCWQGLSREVEGEAIARHHPGATVLVQVAFSSQGDRRGAAEEEVRPLVASLQDRGLDVKGLMTVAPHDREAASLAFRRLRELADSLGLPERSMGMSEDLELAVAEGATMIRIGRALFGARPTLQGREEREATQLITGSPGGSKRPPEAEIAEMVGRAD